MRTLAILVVIQISIFTSFAQYNFREGYVVTNNNDSIYGFIDYKGSKASSKFCIFKKGQSDTIVKYIPEDLKSYRFIDGKYYVSKEITRNNEKQILFLEYLINGIKDIYYYRDNDGEHYLINIGEAELKELRNDEKKVVVNNVSYIKKSEEYKGVLRYAFNESPQTTKKIDNTRLNHKSLIKIAKDFHYNVCDDEECIVYEKKEVDFDFRFGSIVGFSYKTFGSFNDFSKEKYYLEKALLSNSNSLTFGGYIGTNIPYINERLFFQTEILYTQLESGLTNRFFSESSNLIYNTDITLSAKGYHLAFLFNYEFPDWKYRPHLKAGFYMNSLQSNYKEHTVGSFENGVIYTTIEENNEGRKMTETGIKMSIRPINVSFTNFALFLKFDYQFGKGIIYRTKSNTISLSLGLQF